MKLTRKILIEKKNKFWIYDNPNDVPGIAWKIFYNEIRRAAGVNADIINYIAKEIFSPLIGKKDYKISKDFYDLNGPTPSYSSYRTITFDEGLKFKVNLELISDLTSYMSNPFVLKELMCLMWEDAYNIEYR